MQILDATYWDNLWQNNDYGWDIGNVSTPLAAYIDQLPDKTISIFIPGCGNAHEAQYLLGKGFTNFTLIDIAPSLVEELRKRLHEYIGNGLQIICGNFFEHVSSYDLILEQTFFCTLPPNERQAYVSHMHQLLKSGGRLAGLLFNRSFDENPPFGGYLEEYQSLFAKHFIIQKMEDCYNSIPPRRGSELFFILKKTD
ncbi:MAG: methyltransferase [Bacteroidota bacterium]